MMRPGVATILSLLATAALALGQASSDGDPPFGIINGVIPRDGVLFGGQPSEEQLESLAEAGYETILDLRGEEEDRGYDERAAAAELGLSYRAIPVTAETLDDEALYDAFFAAFEKAERPILVHCGSGNRVGALYYAYLVKREGASREAALAAARENGLRSQQLTSTIDSYLGPE